MCDGAAYWHILLVLVSSRPNPRKSISVSSAKDLRSAPSGICAVTVPLALAATWCTERPLPVILTRACTIPSMGGGPVSWWNS